MNIEELLEEIDEILDKAWGLPGGKSVIDAEKIRVAIDDIRLNMPQETKQARAIVADKADIINTAKKEAEGIIRAAEERARALVAQEEITRLAQAKASEIIAGAQAKSRDMRRAAQDFVDDLMKRTDEGLTQHLAEIRKTRASLKQQRPVVTNDEQ
ncbi:MAG: ATPase [Clostridia bacterium]|nr:ATPase [Clostridia bacterium]